MKDNNGQIDAARTKLEFYANNTAQNQAFEELTNAYEKTIHNNLIEIGELKKELDGLKKKNKK